MTRPAPKPGSAVVCELRSEANADVVRDGDKTVGFAGIAYSGGPVRQPFSGEMAVDLSGMRIKDMIPITLNHDDGKIVGRARVVNDGKTLRIVDGAFSEATEHGKMVAALMAEGHPWEFSIGAGGTYVNADRKRPVELNGRKMPLDSYLTQSRLLHVSFVPAGADPDAIATKLSALFQPEPSTMPDPQQQTDDASAARIRELEQANATLTSQLAAANERIAATAKAAREGKIAALFGADAEIPDAERAAYLAMSDDAFAALESGMRRVAASADGTLFAHQARSGRDGERAPAVKLPTTNGLPPDPERAALHARIVEYQAKHPNTDYVTAALAVEQGA